MNIYVLLKISVKHFKSLYYRVRYRLRYVHKSTYFGGASNLSRDLKTERFVYIGPQCSIYPGVHIGEFSMLANNVSIIGGDHVYDKPGYPMLLSGRAKFNKTTIGRDCWIGAHAIILTGVHIADCCVIAAGSIVTKDTIPFGVYAGVPAKLIKKRFANKADEIKHLNSLSKWQDNQIPEFIIKMNPRIIKHKDYTVKTNITNP